MNYANFNTCLQTKELTLFGKSLQSFTDQQRTALNFQ